MICIYHSRDLDGWMSTAIVKLKYPDVKLIGWDYGVPMPDWEKEIDGHKVVMTDVSFPKTTMLQYMDFNDLIWLDHHISAIRDVGDIATEIQGIRDPEFAACELTWKYFFPTEKMPEIVRLLGRYDCFGHKGTDEEQYVLEFQYGARMIMNDPVSCYYQLIGKGLTIQAIHSKGEAIYKYLCAEAQQIYKRKFDITLSTKGDEDRDWTKDDKEYLFACVNQDRFNPINFGIDYHKDGYDGFACFWYTGKQWTYSLYNDNGDVDCSVLARARGGGGHKGASGFQTNELIFK